MDNQPELRYTLKGGYVPERAYADDAGIDLCAAEDLRLNPGQRQLVSTGISIALPDGTVGDIRPRSGLAAKHGVTVLNAPGTIDAGYRGEIKVNLINHGRLPHYIAKGDRIAQLVVLPILTPKLVQVLDLNETERGTGGHGSTGY